MAREKVFLQGLNLFSHVSQAGWTIDIELVVGPEVGISYITQKSSTVSIA